MIAYLITIAILVIIAALIGLALNLQWGLAGLVNFGVVGFVAIGAYTTALTAPAIGWLPAMLLAAFVAAALSAGLALLSIRLEENYLAIITIGFGEAVRLVILNEGWLTNGALGIADIQRPFPGLTERFGGDIVFVVFAIGVLAVVFVALEGWTRAPFGRALRAIRDDATISAALGKPVFALRVRAFAIGGAVMGLAGALQAFYLTYIDPSQFSAIVTSYAFMAVIAGGRGSNVGLLVGAGSIMALLEGTRFLKDFISVIDGVQLSALRLGLIGVGIILLLILRPQGLVPEARRKAADVLAKPREAA
ncbi:amino acid/amide ABC transporter membrane protein 2 (HAAT family) [Ancylobacter aquaticus]|uniref:Amino acid/amide ABC transporter membrane protein 2 (HAAT family) n=1 Tax=Ancylobacter aquaticus TaxID=100 RepID=A0A4R1I4Y1_ANCAQ|nr:branched-chain amino acid ABC transporter permease [Ancylobacter aquaticus]TCK30367.1 amino acid/amide ABC transporter membrane protein 2 (HAAT family) [Ancylobacter aquaticus]